MRRRTFGLSAAAAALLLATAHAQQPSTAALATLKTTAEASDYKSTSTYDDVVKFMKTVADASPIVHYTTYGKTYEGRDMPMAVVGTGLKDASAASVKATGKLRVHIQANIHAGEVEGKESAQILLRELALGQHADWLKSMVLLVTPIFNADGNERFALTNRPRQNGPINGMGTRANAQGLNINRDFMKLDTPEARAFVTLWNDYDPQVGFDLHTSDGSYHAYYLTYAPGLNPDTSDTILNIQKSQWFPFVTDAVKDRTNTAAPGLPNNGWDTFYYGVVSSGARGRGRGRGGDSSPAPALTGPQPANAQPRIWATFEHVPRFHNNYVGLRNRFALLSEAYAYATFEDRIKATSLFLDAALDFAATHADELARACAQADRESIVGKPLGTRAQMKRGGMIQILMGEVEDEINPNNGAVMNRRKDVVHPEQMVDMLWFESTKTEVVPATYYVPADATNALALLHEHGIRMRQISSPVRGVEQFTITANTAAPARGGIDFGTHQLRTLEGDWAPAPGVTVPAGAWEVSMSQPLARLAFYLLAPTSDDGLVTWNVLDDYLKDGATTYPILRKR